MPLRGIMLNRFAVEKTGWTVQTRSSPTSENIVMVLRSELAETGKWAPDQVLYLQLAIDLLEQGRRMPGPR